MVGDILQPTHLLFVLIVALLVLGPKRLPEVGRALGDGLRDFKSAINGESHHRHDEVETAYRHDEVEADEHESAHEDSETDAPALAHEETPTSGHEFGGTSADPSETIAVENSTVAAAGDKHEFAYKSSDPAPSRDEPHS